MLGGRIRSLRAVRRKPVAGDTVKDANGVRYTVGTVGLNYMHVTPIGVKDAKEMLCKTTDMFLEEEVTGGVDSDAA